VKTRRKGRLLRSLFAGTLALVGIDAYAQTYDIRATSFLSDAREFSDYRLSIDDCSRLKEIEVADTEPRVIPAAEAIPDTQGGSACGFDFTMSGSGTFAPSVTIRYLDDTEEVYAENFVKRRARASISRMSRFPALTMSST